MKSSQHVLEESNASVRMKLATLWASFMFLYIYVDYFSIYLPGRVDHILQGKVFVFEITQVFLLSALISVSIPALMIFLSAILPAKVNRTVNIITAIVFIPYSLFNLTGEAWLYMVFGATVEVILLCLILRYAWKWPHADHSN